MYNFRCIVCSYLFVTNKRGKSGPISGTQCTAFRAYVLCIACSGILNCCLSFVHWRSLAIDIFFQYSSVECGLPLHTFLCRNWLFYCPIIHKFTMDSYEMLHIYQIRYDKLIYGGVFRFFVYMEMLTILILSDVLKMVHWHC